MLKDHKAVGERRGVRAGGGSECLLWAKLVLSHASQGSGRLSPSSLFYRRGNLDSERLSNSHKAEKTELESDLRPFQVVPLGIL